MSNSKKMIIGYIIGGSLVLILLPSIFYFATSLVDKLFRIEIIQNDVLRLIVTLFLMLIGLIFGIWSIVIQNVVGKGGPVELANVEISPKTKNLVVVGPYKYTRNPMLFGTFLMYFALAVIINSVTTLVLVALFAVFMLLVVVKKEEERLLKDFGTQYEEYRKKTSMIIPWFTRK